jgi:hypothetical protein
MVWLQDEQKNASFGKRVPHRGQGRSSCGATAFSESRLTPQFEQTKIP